MGVISDAQFPGGNSADSAGTLAGVAATGHAVRDCCDRGGVADRGAVGVAALTLATVVIEAEAPEYLVSAAFLPR